MLKDIKMRFVIQMGITYFTSGYLKSGQMQQFLMQDSLGQNLCNSHPPLQNNCPVWTFHIKEKRRKEKQTKKICFTTFNYKLHIPNKSVHMIPTFTS